jgi:hypothetical protein
MCFHVRGTDRSVLFDFDGDGKTDISLYRPGAFKIFSRTTSYFWILRSSDRQVKVIPWGVGGDRAAPADYDGDGITDPAVFRWYDEAQADPWVAADYWINYSSGGHSVIRLHGWGMILNRNFFGDARAEPGIFEWRVDEPDPSRPCLMWHFLLLPDDESIPAQDRRFIKDVIEACEDDPLTRIPALGDYNNDGVSDLAVFTPGSKRHTVGTFQVWNSPFEPGFTEPDETRYFNVQFPIPGDYDGDGKTDFAGGEIVDGKLVWKIASSITGQSYTREWGAAGDKPVPGDYDGDGKTDIAVFRPGEGLWFILLSSNGSTWVERFGMASDIPIPQPNAFYY